MKFDARFRIRTGAFAALLMLCSAGVALSQDRQKKGNFDPVQMVDRQVTAMKERLKLTDDQEKTVRTILTDSAKKTVEMRAKYQPQQGQPPSEEMRAEMKKNRGETTKKIGEVLSKEQMADYEKMMAERRGQGGNRKRQ